jgi:serine protease
MAAGSALVVGTMLPASFASASPSPAVPPAPLQINGKHVFWAAGVPTVGQSTVSSGTYNDLIYHSGPVMTAPKVYITFWGSEWTNKASSSFDIPVKKPSGQDYTLANLRTYMTAFFRGIGGTSWNNINTQYCQGGAVGDVSCGTGTTAIKNPHSVLGGVWDDPSEPPAVIDTLGLAENAVPDPVATEAEAAAAHFGFTSSVPVNAVFFVFAPPGRVDTGATPYGAYCGYHTEVTPSNLTGEGIRYAFIPYILDVDLGPGSKLGSCGMNYVNKANDNFGHGIFDGFSIVSGHEFSEAVTDPDAWPTQTGWNDYQTNEIGDKCAWISSGQGAAQDIPLRTGSFAVQSLWSNAFNNGAGGCVISYP